MLTVGIVLLIIVLSITVVTYNREIERKENIVWNGKFDRFIKAESVEEIPKDPLFFQHNYLSEVDIAFVDKQGNICDTPYPDIFEKINVLEEQKGRTYGVIYAKHKVREASIGEYEYCIVIAELSTVYRQIQGIFFIGLSIVLGAMCIFYFISRKLADVAVKPTEEAWKQQKRFIADASHDLKTPLTVIMANNDIMLSHPNSAVAEQKKWLESTKEEGEHMQALINKMLELARSESLVAYEKNVEIVSEITPNIVVKSNGEEFTRLVYILVDNAIKYAPVNSKITVRLYSTKKGVILDINNSGSVISKEELPHIFERFYRSDSARTNGGFGLGLSIAKNIVTALNGEISATSTKENGTTFTVKLK